MRRLLSYVAQLSMLIVVAGSTLPLAYAQGCATTPPLGPPTWAFPQWPTTTITVNIDPAWTVPADRDAIKAGFEKWSLPVNRYWGAVFTFTNNSTPLTGTNTVQVTRNIGNWCPAPVVCRGEVTGTDNGSRRTSGLMRLNSEVN